MALPLDGRTAIVTGGTRGIGRAISLHLACLGANLVLNYASNSAQADLLAVAAKADVSDPESVKSLFSLAEEAFGSRAHILIHNAGVLDSKYPTIASTSLEDFDAAFGLHARGTFLCCREAANRLVRGGGGRIVVASSSLVGLLAPGYGAYAASKAAAETLTRILAKELRGTGITANCVAPGPIATELFFEGKSEEAVRRFADANPMGRLGEVEDVAPVVGFLCRDEAEWVNGQVIRINGGVI